MEKGLFGKIVILTGKAGGIESYQLLLTGEKPIEEYIPSAYHETPEYNNRLTEISTEFATKLLDHGERDVPGIANGFRVTKSSEGWGMTKLERIDYKEFELMLRGRLQTLSRGRSRLAITAEQTNLAIQGGISQ